MKPRLILRPTAYQDMEDTANYLAARSPDAADRFVDACVADFGRLAEMPGMGRLREFKDPKAANLLSWPVTGFGNYLIFYRPVEDGIEVLHVIHGARDIDAIFEARAVAVPRDGVTSPRRWAQRRFGQPTPSFSSGANSRSQYSRTACSRSSSRRCMGGGPPGTNSVSSGRASRVTGTLMT